MTNHEGEDLPEIWVKINGKECELTRHNTALYTFFGKTAMYNHVFVEIDPHQEQGIYFFETLVPKDYKALREVIIERSFPQALNSNNILDYDVKAFDDAVVNHLKILDDGLPEGWI